MEFVFGCLLVAGIWYFLSTKKKINTFVEADLHEVSRPWFDAQGFDTNSLRYQWYHDPQLVKNHGAAVVVGVGKKRGASTGFVLEVAHQRGVLESSVLSDSVVSWHASAARTASQTGQSLIRTLIEMDKIERDR